MPVPPSSKLQIREASKLYEEFSGHEAEIIGELPKPTFSGPYKNLGRVSAIEYDTVRDFKKEYYRHDFERGAGPTLAQYQTCLRFIGGAYDFTERGIVDRSYSQRNEKLTRRKIPDVLIAVGEISAIECNEKSRFEFPRNARPLLCSSFDGSQLFALGGAYNVETRSK